MPDEVELHFSSAGYVGDVIRANKQAKLLHTLKRAQHGYKYVQVCREKQGYNLPLSVKNFRTLRFYVKSFTEFICLI